MTGSRRANGESWIPDEPNARGYYEAFVWMGTKPDGRADRRHVERRSKAARNKAARELERKRDAGVATKAGRVKTVEQMLTRHIDVVLPQRGRAPLTIRSYRSLCEHQVYPRWGGQRIDRLLPEYIEDGYAEMLAGGLTARTVRKVHAVLSSAYEIEVRRGNVARNPCNLVEPPRLPQADKKALTATQARTVLAATAKRRNGSRWSVGWPAACASLRRSACAGRSSISTPARCASGGSCSGCRGAMAAATSRSALRAGIAGRARGSARRSASPGAPMCASRRPRRGCASRAAPVMQRSAPSGSAAVWCSARSRNAAARRWRFRRSS
jgi:hypothetical protein